MQFLITLVIHSKFSFRLRMFRHIKSLSTSRPPVINFSEMKSSNQGSPALILRSTSHNIYKNLALEDWFYQNHNFEKNKILLFYKNAPCVVIGRHQNPWTEANIPYLRKNSIQIRTNSDYLVQILF